MGLFSGKNGRGNTADIAPPVADDADELVREAEDSLTSALAESDTASERLADGAERFQERTALGDPAPWPVDAQAQSSAAQRRRRTVTGAAIAGGVALAGVALQRRRARRRRPAERARAVLGTATESVRTALRTLGR